MPKPDVIGLVGFAQVGKSTAAEYLSSTYGYEHRGFADKLRDVAAELDPEIAGRRYSWWIGHLGYEQAKADVPGFREFLKRLGNSMRRHVSETVWVDALMLDVTAPTVVADTRFFNEAHAIREHWGSDGLLIRIERPGYGPESDFEKETGLIEVDATVYNDGDLEVLYGLLDFVVNGA